MKTRLDFVSNSSSSSYIISVEDNPHMMILNDPQLLTLKELVDKFSDRLFSPYNFVINISEAHIVEVSNEEFVKRFMNDTILVDNNDHKIKIHMPHDAIHPYTVSKLLQKTRNTDKWSFIRNTLNVNDYTSEEYDDLSEFYIQLIQAADSAINKACYNVLEQYLKDMRFCYQEISDDYCGYHGYYIDDENPFDMSIDPDAPVSNRKHGVIDPKKVMENRKYQTFYEPLNQPNDECLIDARIAFLEKINGPLKFKRIYSNH